MGKATSDTDSKEPEDEKVLVPRGLLMDYRELLEMSQLPPFSKSLHINDVDTLLGRSKQATDETKNTEVVFLAEAVANLEKHITGTSPEYLEKVLRRGRVIDTTIGPQTVPEEWRDAISRARDEWQGNLEVSIALDSLERALDRLDQSRGGK